MNFSDAVEIILEKEGGYIAHPADPGGATNFGISQKAYPEIKDIKSLTREQAIAIYLRDYWNKCAIDAIPLTLRLMVFDASVQHGPKTAVRMLQSAVGVKADGDFGPVTFKAVKEADPKAVLMSIAKQRLKLYMTLPHFSSFGLGWLNRLIEMTVRSVG